MKALFYKYLTIFLTGGLVYYFLEIFTRGYSHFSMIICGGLCMVICGALNQTFPGLPVIWQMLLSGIIITIFEFITGVIVNIILKIGVWDYSYMPFNFMGQICLPYTGLWMLMSLFIIFVDDGIRCFLFDEKMPEYALLKSNRKK